MGQTATSASASRVRDWHEVQLHDRWRGVVLGDGTAEPLDESARSWLRTLTTDAARLPGYTTLKYSHSVEVIKVEVPAALAVEGPNRLVVCKCAKSAGPLVVSRAKKNFRRGLRLMRAGIGTARPIALLERGRESWLITQYLPDLVDLDQFALTVLPKLDASEARRRKAEVIKCVVRLFARLLEDGLHHRDLKASNILLKEVHDMSGDCAAILLDLDGLRTWTLRPHTAEHSRFARLTASLLQYRSITRSDYARFLRGYLRATIRDQNEWRVWFGNMARSATSYNRRAQGRKADKLDGYAG